MALQPYSYHGAFAPLLVWNVGEQWYYSGPAGCGPKAVRESGRGPCWSGKISAGYARWLFHKLRRQPGAEYDLRMEN